MLSAWCGMQQLGSFAIGFPLHNHVDMCCDLTDAQQANDGTPKAAGKAEPTDSDGSEPPLNEDDDDELDDTDQGDEELKTNHLVLAQFDKVTRSKNKWKCTLKDGIMHLNNRDILFVKVCILSLHTQALVS
jgi:hypothetical protein